MPFHFTHALREKRRLFRAEMDSADAEGILALDGCKYNNYCIKLALFAERIDIVPCL